MSLFTYKSGVGLVAALFCACSAPDDTPLEVEAYTVGVDDILPVAYQLAEEANEGSFVVFFFSPSGNLDGDSNLNIQYSIEQGQLGLDWVLTSPDNIASKAEIQTFAESMGYVVESRSGNGVAYLRVEDGGSLFTLGRAVITELFSMPESGELGLYFRGIEFETE